MLVSLKIENVAVIEKAEILFDTGLNVLTGETGAGKSIIIDSINAVLGERTSKQLIRNTADRARVSAIFENVPDTVIQKLEEYDIDCEDGSLLISRVITADGRNSCKINGENVTVSMLKNIGHDLITICGQHDSQHLLSKDHQLFYLDSVAGSDDLFENYKQQYLKVKQISKELSSLIKNESDKQRQLEFLKFQIDELTNANIVPGEKENLLSQKKKIRNKEKITSMLNTAQIILSGDENTPGVLNGLYSLSECLSVLRDYDNSYSAYIEAIDNLKYTLDECASEISRSVSDDEDEFFDINSIEARLDILYRLSGKYGSTEEEMLQYLEHITEEYENICYSEEHIEHLSSELEKSKEDLLQAGCFLSDCRKRAAAEFEKQVTDELKFLDMPDAVFTVGFTDCEPTEDGIDEIEFLFSANKGQKPAALSKIASGGELSRVMLAIRCVLSEAQLESTAIYDEIDTGVSGRAAHKIAYKLHEVSRNRQVLCVTHLAQIASCADNHFLIEKHSDESNTYTKITLLDEEQRVNEVARIIGGDIITKTTLDSAREMINFSYMNS